MTVWTEVQAGDMQREQENAYMFRRSASKDGWAMFCTPVGNPGPITPDFKGEVYARATSGVEFYTMSMTFDDFNALAQDQVGVSTDDPDEGGEEVTDPPVNVDVPVVAQYTGTVSCTMGNWENTPTEYHYQWTLDGVELPDDTPDYYPQPGDVGKTISCVVTAVNAIGSTDAPPSNEIVIAAE